MPQDVSDSSPREFVANRLPWIVAGTALVVYLATLNSWLTATNIALVSSLCGWDWQPVLFQPVLQVVTAPLRLLPEAQVPLALNALSAVLAAATLGLLARSVALLPHNRLPQQRSLEASRHSLLTVPAAWVPVVLAVAACGLQLTFWQHSIAGTGEMLDLLFLAALVRALLEFRVDRRPRWLCQACFLMGLAVANSWAFVGFTPLFLIAVVALGWQDLLSLKLLRRLLLWGLAGAALFLLPPIWQGCVADGNPGFLGTLRHTVGSYYGTVSSLARRLPLFPHIALTVASSSLLPLLFMSVRWRRHSGSTGWFGELLTRGLLNLVHLLLLVACFWAVFDLPFSPRQAVARLGIAPPLLTFNFLAALGIGYYSGFFLLLASRWNMRQGRPKPAQLALQALGRWTIISLVGVLPALLVVKNLPLIREFNIPVYREFAQFAAAQLPSGPTIVLSDDLLRPTLLRAILAGRTNRDDYVFLDTRALPFPEYWKAINKRYPERWPDRPTGASAAESGSPQRYDAGLLTQIVRNLVGTRQVCYLSHGFGTFFDFIYATPAGLVYPLALYEDADLNPPPLSAEALAANEAFWKTNSAALRASLASQQALREQQKANRPKGLLKHLRVQEELPFQSRQVATWLSAAANTFGVQRQRDGQPAAATWFFEEAHRLQPENLVAEYNLRANTNLVAGRPAPFESRQSITERQAKTRDWSAVMREGGPFDHPTFCFDFATAFVQAGYARQAAQQWDRTRRLAPDFLPAWLRLGSYFNLRKQPESALKLVSEMRSERSLQSELSTNGLDVALIEADALCQQEQFAAAQQVMQAAIAAAPLSGETVSRCVDLHIRYKRFTEAEALITAALQRNPDDIGPLISRGFLELRRGTYTNAVAPLTRALELNPAAPQQTAALLNRAICLMRIGRLDEAQRDYERLLGLAPKSFQAYYGLGEIAWTKGRTNEAIQAYQAYLTNAPAGLDEAEGIRQRLRQLGAIPSSPGAR